MDPYMKCSECKNCPKLNCESPNWVKIAGILVEEGTSENCPEFKPVDN